jgi:nitronate monooxygenase
MNIMPSLKIGDLIAKIPIIQGGMGVGISMSGLAAAVANQGGIGVISTVGLAGVFPIEGMNYREANTIVLKEQIRKARSLTDGIIGLNIMVALSNFEDMIKTAFEEKVDIVFLGAGLPLKLPFSFKDDFYKNAKTKVGLIASSSRSASFMIKHWVEKLFKAPDCIVVEGPKAGGHLGFKPEQIEDPDFQLEKLIPEIKKTVVELEEKYSVKIPVIAAGGIYDGKDMYNIMKLGADGVQLGTRFVATYECDADIAFKNAYVESKESDIGVIKSPLGLPGRAIINSFLKDVANGERKPFQCPWKCLQPCDFKTAPYCIANALLNSQKGNLNEGFAFSGANAYKIDKICSVKDVFDEFIRDYQNA